MDLLTYNYFLYKFWGYIIKSIQVQDSWTCFIITFFISKHGFWLKIILSNDNMATPDFSWLVVNLGVSFSILLLSTFLCHYVLGVSVVNSIQLDFVILSHVRICLLTGEFSLFIFIVVTAIFGSISITCCLPWFISLLHFLF